MNKIKSLNLSALICALVFSLGAMTACQSNSPTAKAANDPLTNNNIRTENTKAETTKSVNISLATPTEAYKTAFSARQKKDVQGLKQVLSKKMLEFFKAMGIDEHKTVDDELKELAEQPQAATAEARNEKITGDKATVEYLDENGKWKTMDFVKEGSDWKLTLPDAPVPTFSETNTKNNKSNLQK